MSDYTPMATKKPTSSWIDVKAKLADCDRAGLLTLVQDLCAASKDNQAFLHTRLHLGEDALKPYKATLYRWLWPDAFKNQDTSVTKAKKAIADYKKALGTPAGLAELMVFYCEQASGFASDVCLDDEGYLGALVRMFGQALDLIETLSPTQRTPLWERLRTVHQTCDGIGYGVDEEMDQMLSEHGGHD